MLDSTGSAQTWLKAGPSVPSPTSKFSLKRLIKPLVGLLSVGLIMFSLLPLLALVFEPTSPPQNILISNVTDHQATVSWTTAKATKGAVVLGKNSFKDDGDKSLGRQGFYTTHSVTLVNLDPAKTYSYTIKQGWHKASTGNFATAATLSSPTSPNPIYGRVLGQDKKPLIGALVYLRATNGNNKSALLSTLTNLEGRWSLDLANLKSADLKGPFPVKSGTVEELLVKAGNKGSGKATGTTGKDNPWPDLVISK